MIAWEILPRREIDRTSYVYLLICCGRVNYVGSTISFATRMQTHIAEDLRGQWDSVARIPVVEEKWLRDVEAAFIWHYQPEYNRDCHGRMHFPISTSVKCAIESLREHGVSDHREVADGEIMVSKGSFAQRARDDAVHVERYGRPTRLPKPKGRHRVSVDMDAVARAFERLQRELR